MRELFPLSAVRVESSELAEVLCYPHPDPHELQARILELTSLGVDALDLTGPKSLGRAGILGKGCVGIVAKARTQGRTVALKIRRTDANRRDMSHEASMLRLANSVGVGPRLLGESRDFLLMEFVEGLQLREWVESLPKARCKTRVRKIISRLLDDCFRLDRIHLDHGELSEAPKNILVDKADNPSILDFESASDRRRPSNLTSIAQYLLIGGAPAKRMRSILRWRRRSSLISSLREYKEAPDQEHFTRIKSIVGV